MRVYVAVTALQVQQLLAGPIVVNEYLTPAQFEFDAQVDDEEQEHLVSLLAAEDAIELNSNRFGLVIAADLNDYQLTQDAIQLEFSQVASLLYSDDAETLSWFAPEEIQYQIEAWLK